MPNHEIVIDRNTGKLWLVYENSRPPPCMPQIWQAGFQAGNFPSTGTCGIPVQVPALESKSAAPGRRITVM